MGKIAMFSSRRARLKGDEADRLRQAVLPFVEAENEIGIQARALLAHIDRAASASSTWTFVMINPRQHGLVVRHLVQHSARPLVAVQVWSLVFEVLDRDTGEVLMSRQEIADRVGDTAAHISSIMSELVQVGAISRKRDGNRVRYYLNPLVGTHLPGEARTKAQSTAPALRLVPSEA